MIVMLIMERRIGIRREDKSEWERRAPLVPEDVALLDSKHSIEVVVQPSHIRVFTDEEYKEVGAEVREDLNAPVIFGVKEMPPDFFERDKIYVFFSHTIKGQEYNMPMLKQMMNKGNTLIDYECIENGNGKRLIAFGKYAGIAGIVESLWAAGKRFEWKGYSTPLTHIKRVLDYHSVSELEKDCSKVGREIIQDGLPNELAPFVIGIAGYGNVSSGVQEVLSYLPVKEIEPDELFELKDNSHTFYKVVFKEEHIVQRKDGGSFDLQDYYDNPEHYKGVFSKYLPYITVLINAIYWEEKYPRLVTKEWLKENYKKKVKDPQAYPLQVVGDISCDIEGAIQCTVECTEPENPVYVYNPESGKIQFGVEGEGPVIMAVDILPSELPRESSIYFSHILKGFIPDVFKASYPDDFEGCTLPDFLKKAVILYKGKLTPKYEYLKDYLQRRL